MYIGLSIYNLKMQEGDLFEKQITTMTVTEWTVFEPRTV